MPFYPNDPGPGQYAFAVTPHNTNAVGNNRGIWVGTGGDITLASANAAADVVLKNVPDGTFIPLSVGYIRDTGTTAADIVAFA